MAARENRDVRLRNERDKTEHGNGGERENPEAESDENEEHRGCDR